MFAITTTTLHVGHGIVFPRKRVLATAILIPTKGRFLCVVALNLNTIDLSLMHQFLKKGMQRWGWQ
jgi:hypothetical protein